MKSALRSSWSSLLPLLSLVLLVIAIGAARPSFLSVLSLQTMAMQSVFVALPALGMTFVVIAGGIDISIGSAADDRWILHSAMAPARCSQPWQLRGSARCGDWATACSSLACGLHRFS